MKMNRTNFRTLAGLDPHLPSREEAVLHEDTSSELREKAGAFARAEALFRFDEELSEARIVNEALACGFNASGIRHVMSFYKRFQSGKEELSEDRSWDRYLERARTLTDDRPSNKPPFHSGIQNFMDLPNGAKYVVAFEEGKQIAVYTHEAAISQIRGYGDEVADKRAGALIENLLIAEERARRTPKSRKL